MTSMRLAPAITFVYLLLVAAALADLASARKRGLEEVRQELMRIYGAQGSPKRILRPRKGCASFGHSCFGGHGKRAVEEILPPRDYDLPIASSDNTIDEQRAANNEIEPDIVPILRQWIFIDLPEKILFPVFKLYIQVFPYFHIALHKVNRMFSSSLDLHSRVQILRPRKTMSSCYSRIGIGNWVQD